MRAKTTDDGRIRTPPSSVTSTEVLTTRLSYTSWRLYQSVFFEQQTLFRSESNRTSKKSLEKSTIILEKRKTVKQNCITNVYNNCFSFEAINNRLTSEEWPSNRRYLVCCKTKFKAMARCVEIELSGKEQGIRNRQDSQNQNNSKICFHCMKICLLSRFGKLQKKQKSQKLYT